jgi:hypothetical protein
MSIPREIIRLQVRIETIAEQHSRPGKSRLGLDETLAGPDQTGRRHVRMILEAIRAFSDNPDEKAAAEHIQRQAARAWYGPTIRFAGEHSDPTRTTD